MHPNRGGKFMKGRIADIDADAGINLVNTHFDVDTHMFGVHDLVGDKVVVETKVASKDVNLSVDEVTLAQALAALKSAKPKDDKVMLKESEQGTITTTTVATTVTTASTRPKAKGLVIHEHEQYNVQAMDRLLSNGSTNAKQKNKRSLSSSRIRGTNHPKLKLKREIPCPLTEKHGGYKNNQLKNKSIDDIQKLFDKAMKKVNIFIDLETELVKGSEVRAKAEITQESSSKRAGTELEQESIKKQKVDDDKETAEL
ncbi:hypothetical protein Tco_0292122 [Tanacetum coccineum]